MLNILHNTTYLSKVRHSFAAPGNHLAGLSFMEMERDLQLLAAGTVCQLSLRGARDGDESVDSPERSI